MKILSIAVTALAVVSVMAQGDVKAGNEIPTNDVPIKFWTFTGSSNYHNTNWNGNMISTTRNYLSTNWVTISRTIPEVPPDKIQLLAHKISILNQIGTVSSNVVAEVEWNGSKKEITMETTVVDQLSRQIAGEPR